MYLYLAYLGGNLAAGRLGEDHEVVIVVHDAEVGDDHGNNGGSLLRLPRHLEELVGAQAIALAEHHAVRGHSPGLGHFGREGPGEAEQASEGAVDALTDESVGYGKASGLHDQDGSTGASSAADFFSRTARVPSSCTPRIVRMMNSPMLETIAMSATLKIAGNR